MNDREKVIVRTSILGIVVNALLAGFKAAVGIAAHSIAIVLDAVNNLSDALSSIITIIGTRYAMKPADRKHPLGHGRAEYLSAMSIAVLVLYAGLTSLVESIQRILHPVTPDYQTLTLTVVAVAVATKLLLGTFVKRTGEHVHSDSLVASGTDAFFDAVISVATLIAAGVYLIWHLSVEAYLGTAISIYIIRSGIELLKDTLSRILGERVDSDLTQAIKHTIVETDPEIIGVYDLILHNYGPDQLLGSVHIELPDTTTIDRLDDLTREVGKRVYEEHGVILEAVGVYSYNTSDDEAIELRMEVTRLVMAHEYVLQMHGFYADIRDRHMSFDVIIDFAAPDRHAVYNEILQEVRAAWPDYQIQVTLDLDISD